MLENFHKDKKDSYLDKEEGTPASDSPDNSEGNKFTVFYMVLKRQNDSILTVLIRLRKNKLLFEVDVCYYQSFVFMFLNVSLQMW